MERCPNCGTDVREGSKFCTICGQRFADGGSETLAHPPEPESAPAASGADQDALADHAMAAWPVFAPADEPMPEGWSWQATVTPPATDDDGESETAPSAESEANIEVDPWAPGSARALPEEPASASATPERLPARDQATGVPAGPDPVELVDRASQMLSELREVLAVSPNAPIRDLSGVISELEVAVTPPGAMPPDQLGALRDALLAARARPRDLDTIVDLTSRIDAMVSLVIAYDRATAAIERTLDVLRGTGQSETN
jgi:hypothetical protein